MSTNTSATPVEQARELIVRALEILSTVESSMTRKPTEFDSVAEVVAKAFRLQKDELFERNRRGEVSRARQVAMYLCHQKNANVSQIAKYFARDRATVFWGIGSTSDLMSQNKKFKAQVESIGKTLGIDTVEPKL